jgi:predicted amidohydrolase
MTFCDIRDPTAIIERIMSIKVAACQVPDIQMNVEATLQLIESATTAVQADLVCFLECFLQGYLTDEALAREYAIDLSSPEFVGILSRLSAISPTLAFGMIERDDEQLFNTAVIIRGGRLIGKYRKTCLLPGEQVFTPGNSYPIFKLNGTRFGVNICYDMQFPEPATAVA